MKILFLIILLSRLIVQVHAADVTCAIQADNSVVCGNVLLSTGIAAQITGWQQRIDSNNKQVIVKENEINELNKDSALSQLNIDEINRALIAAKLQDTTAPQLTVIFPTNNLIVSGVIQIAGTASDNFGLQLIRTRMDLGIFANASGLDSWSISLNTSLLVNGFHTLQVDAIDQSNNITSKLITINVEN